MWREAVTWTALLLHLMVKRSWRSLIRVEALQSFLLSVVWERWCTADRSRTHLHPGTSFTAKQSLGLHVQGSRFHHVLFSSKLLSGKGMILMTLPLGLCDSGRGAIQRGQSSGVLVIGFTAGVSGHLLWLAL